MFRWVGYDFLPKSFFIDIAFLLIFCSFLILIKSYKWSVVYMVIVLSFPMTIFLINATIYSVYFDLFTLQQLMLLTEAKDVFNFEFLSYSSIAVAFVIGVSFFALMIILWKKYFKKRDFSNNYKKRLFVFLTINILVVLVFVSGNGKFKDYKQIGIITTYKRAYLEEYGIYGYYLKETSNLLFGFNLNGNQADVPYLESEESDYFGLLENANILTIMAESLQPFAVNEELTPNLHRVVSDGIYLSNNYSENKTNVSEAIGFIGNYPSMQLLPKTYDYDFSFSLPNVLRDTYRTAYFHDNYGEFYARSDLLPDMGFEEVYFHDDLYPGEELYKWNGDYTLDSKTVDEVLDLVSFTDVPFYYYWSSLSMHGPYNNGPANILTYDRRGYFDRIDQAVADGAWVNPLENGTDEDRLRIRHYQAAVMDFDLALGKLLDGLEDSGQLDNTIIVIFGDHNLYYHNLHLKINEVSGNEYYETGLYDTFMAFYNPILSEEFLINNEDNIIERFTSPYDLVPTLYDLLGLKYNKNLFPGNSIFLSETPVFYSHKLTGFFNDNFYSDDGEEIIYNSLDFPLSKEEEFLLESAKQRVKLDYINYWYNETKRKK